MHSARRGRRAQARLADEYCQAMRDAAIHPAIHYHLARARIADVYCRARRDALARAAPPRAVIAAEPRPEG